MKTIKICHENVGKYINPMDPMLYLDVALVKKLGPILTLQKLESENFEPCTSKKYKEVCA